MFFFFNDTATTEIYTLSLHDALPISAKGVVFLTLEDETGIANIVVWNDVFQANRVLVMGASFLVVRGQVQEASDRSEEHTSELQSHSDLVCRLLLEKKNKVTTLLLCV